MDQLVVKECLGQSYDLLEEIIKYSLIIVDVQRYTLKFHTLIPTYDCFLWNSKGFLLEFSEKLLVNKRGPTIILLLLIHLYK